MIKEYDVVKTLVEKSGFKAGTEDVVVSIYADKKACEVEYGMTKNTQSTLLRSHWTNWEK